LHLDVVIGSQSGAGLYQREQRDVYAADEPLWTLDKILLTRIDASSNVVVRQWVGEGDDSIRAGLGSIWVTNLKAGLVWRISPDQL